MAGQENQQYTVLYGRLSQEDEVGVADAPPGNTEVTRKHFPPTSIANWMSRLRKRNSSKRWEDCNETGLGNLS